MKKTKIDWADSSWNPVTGCLRGCEYCYARRIAERFGGTTPQIGEFDHFKVHHPFDEAKRLYELDSHLFLRKDGISRKAPYPFFFAPTLHRYRLDEPEHWTKPRTIFVCSMADLFGDWVPDEWIEDVFRACEAAPHHRYMFLTKNPKRYIALARAGKLPKNENFWYGSTVTNDQMRIYYADEHNTFVSIEPILERFDCNGVNNVNHFTDWIIIGAETGNRKERVIPEKEWIDELAECGRQSGVPVFMKESLRGLMGDDFRQEFPWEVDDK